MQNKVEAKQKETNLKKLLSSKELLLKELRGNKNNPEIKVALDELNEFIRMNILN